MTWHLNQKKLNYELLGMGDAHIHWHIFPRRTGDTKIPGPVWWMDKEEMWAEKNRPNEKTLNDMKEQLLQNLDKIL